MGSKLFIYILFLLMEMYFIVIECIIASQLSIYEYF